MAKVLITGGTGMIGTPLTQLVLEGGHEVVHLSRSGSSIANVKSFLWDPTAGKVDPKALEGVDHIIHLAGAGIADKPWTPERRQEIIDSRVKTTETLMKACEKRGILLDSFISASAIGYYPLEISNATYSETSKAGDGYLADVCKKWESAADEFKDLSKRVVKLRIGLVLAKDQGALKQIALPVKFYAAAGLGSGKQAMSWIHINDVCRMFVHSIENPLDGVYNAVGPDTITNQEFMQILADVMEKPLMLPNVPDFLIKMIFGEKADLILKGVRVTSSKILDTGFEFDYPTLNSALLQLYR